MSKFTYFNDTKRIVNIHPATETRGVECDMSPIEPLSVRTFELPDSSYPFIKMWDYGKEFGLQLLVSPTKDDISDNNMPKHIGKYPIEFSFTEKSTGDNIVEFCEKALKTPDLNLAVYIMLKEIKSQAERHLGGNKYENN